MVQSTRVTRPATPADFHRLADLAQQRGLRVFEAGPNRWFCTSASNPHGLHCVTGFSCECPGFISHQRCSHHAALLAHLGWLPELPEVEEPGPASSPAREWPNRPCSWCYGTGRTEGFYSDYVPCCICDGTGVRPVVELIAA